MRRRAIGACACVLILLFSLYGCEKKKEYVVETERYYVADGSQDFTITHTYDADGNRIESNATGYPLFVQYTYNKKGYLIEETGSEWGSEFVKSYEVDSKGRTVRKVFEYDGQIISTVSYEYSGERVTSEKWGDKDNTQNRRIEYHYDSSGRLVRVETISMSTSTKYNYDSSGKLVGLDKATSETMTYEEIENDSNGNKVKSTQFTEAGAPTGQVITYKYDEHGNMTEELGYQDGELLYGREYTYIKIG